MCKVMRLLELLFAGVFLVFRLLRDELPHVLLLLLLLLLLL